MRHLSAFVVVLAFFASVEVGSAQTPTPAAAAPEAVRVGGGIKAPVKTKNVEPIYPQLAQAAKKEGIVILELLVAPTGTVQNARVLKSEPLLDNAALDAVRQWEYTPTLLNGVPVPVYYNIVVSFSLAKTGDGVQPGVSDTPAATQPTAGNQTTSPSQPTDPGAQPAVRVGGMIKAPTKIVHVDPVYPEAAVAAHVEGVVIFELLVAPQGFVQDAKILKSVPELDQAALDAVLQWVYTPTLLNGVPVPVLYNVTVAFSARR